MLTPAEHYSLSALITAIAAFVLLVFVGRKSTNRKLAGIFVLYTASITTWSFFVSACTWTRNHDLSYIFCLICHIGGVFVPVSFLHFVKAFTENKSKFVKWILQICYTVTFFVVATIILKPALFIPDVVPKLSFHYFPNPGPIFIFWTILMIAEVVTAMFILLIASLKASGIENKASLSFLIANLIGYLGVVGCFFPVYNFSFFPFPYGIWGAFFFTCVTAFAVMRYKLFDIDVFIRRATVFAGLFAFVYAVFTIFTLLGQNIFHNYLGWSSWASAIPSIVIITIALRPLENLLTNLTEKYLFQKKYNYRELLKTFTSEVLTVLELDKLLDKTIQGLSRIIKLESCVVFLYDSATQVYSLKAGSAVDLSVSYSKDDALVYRLNASNEPILKSQHHIRSKINDDIVADMKKIGAQLCLPIVINEKLVGLIGLGMKKSGEDYTQEDLDILTSLARTESIAISNAQLFAELSKTQAEAAQREKMAVIGTLAAGINHEICNPLGIARGQCEMFLLNYKDGLYENVDPKELNEKCLEIFNKVIKEVDRATGITKRLSSFAKPSSKFAMNEVDVNEATQEVLAILGHELRMDNIQVVTTIPTSIPKLLADKKQLEEILFNIIRNAAQAITGSGRIAVNSFEKEERIYVEIEDSGSGIPADKINEIFNPFYTTKAPGKGTGLGLFIVKQIVERNKGTIAVQSELGKGTKFTLSFEAVKQMAVA